MKDEVGWKMKKKKQIESREERGEERRGEERRGVARRQWRLLAIRNTLGR